MADDFVLRASAILCDMDGTLVDSTAAVVRAWTEFSAEHGLDAAEVLAYCHGRLTHDTVDVFLPHLPAEERMRLADELLAGESVRHDGVVEVPGAAAFITRLTALGVPVALVTSAPRALATARMGVSGVDVPIVTVTSDDVTDGKPHPEPYLRGAELLGVPIEQCLVLEDADAGIVSGLTAGARVLVVGSHESPTTEGLPRALDLTSVRVERDGDEVVLTTEPDSPAAEPGRLTIRLMNSRGTPWPLWDAEGPMPQSRPRLHPGLEARVRAWARDFATCFSSENGWDDPSRAHRHAKTAATLRDEIAATLGPETDVVLELWECPDTGV